jgi:hypothetical protein
LDGSTLDWIVVASTAFSKAMSWLIALEVSMTAALLLIVVERDVSEVRVVRPSISSSESCMTDSLGDGEMPSTASLCRRNNSMVACASSTLEWSLTWIWRLRTPDTRFLSDGSL